jgi:hypothetical protein
MNKRNSIRRPQTALSQETAPSLTCFHPVSVWPWWLIPALCWSSLIVAFYGAANFFIRLCMAHLAP